MAFTNNVTLADYVVQRLIENKGIYNKCNRAFDSMVKPGATAILVNKLAIPVLKTAGTTSTHADRKNAHADTTMVTIPLAASAVPLATEVIADYEGGGALPAEYLESARAVIAQGFDTNVLTEAQTTTDVDTFAGSVLSWADITGIRRQFIDNKVPDDKLVLAIDSDLFEQFMDIDVVKNATSWKGTYMETGEFPKILGMDVIVSSLVPKVGGKATLTAFSGYGLSFVLNRMGEIKERYDEVNLKDVVDMLAHSGQKLFADAFAVVRTAQ